MVNAEILVIGGGVIGSAVSYYLSTMKPGRIILLERETFGGGNSSLAAGLLSCGRLHVHQIPLVLETYRAIQTIEKNLNMTIGLRKNGSLYSALSPSHQKNLRKLAEAAWQAGLKAVWLDAADAHQLVPWLTLPAANNNLYMPDDGFIDGYSLTMGYLKSAEMNGVEKYDETEVLEIIREGEKITGIKTSKGPYQAKLVIDAAGIWAGLLAMQIGINLPMAPIRSHYWISDYHHQVTSSHPTLILPLMYIAPLNNNDLSKNGSDLT